MSLFANLKSFENAINNFRIGRKLRILWPDYELYDLLAKGISISQLGYYSSARPYIIPVPQDLTELQFPFDSKQYNHIAFAQQREVDEKLQKITSTFAILTRRGFAVDQLLYNYTNGVYAFSIQINQFDRQICFWGIQTLSDQVRVIGPKFIRKRGPEWFLEFVSKVAVKSILFYSVKRQPQYGSNSYHVNELPKDAKLELCMKLRTYKSHLNGRFCQQEKFIMLNATFFNKPGFIFQPSKQQNELKQKQLHPKLKLQLQQKNAGDDILPKLISNPIKITISQLPKPSRIENALEKPPNIKQLFIEISQIKLLAMEAIEQVFDKNSTENDKYLPIYCKQLSHLNQLSNQDVEQIFWKSQRNNYPHMQIYSYSILVERYILNLQNRQEWLKLFELNQMNNEDFKPRIQKFLLQILAIEGQLLKDYDQDLKQQLKKVGPEIKYFIAQALDLNQANSMIMSDLLFILMQQQSCINIFQLYQRHLLNCNNLYVTSSLNQWLQHSGYPCNQNVDMLYQSVKDIPRILSFISQHERPQLEQYSQHYQEYELKFHLQSSSFPNHSIIASRKLHTLNIDYCIYLIRKDYQIYCFLQEYEHLDKTVYHNYFHSYDIVISIIINGKRYIHNFGWSFSHPTHSVGSLFHLEKDINYCDYELQCQVFMRKNVIHQSIMNYMKVRYTELSFNNASFEVQSKKLAKRRSSFMLERELIQVNFCQNLPEVCYFHTQCQKCDFFLKKTSIYMLSPTDMYALLASIPFTLEINALLTTLKYLSLHPLQYQNEKFWRSHLRIELLQMKKLLELSTKQPPLNVAQLKLINGLIQLKCDLVRQKQQVGIFINKDYSRMTKQSSLFIEQQYSEQFIQFLKINHQS